MEKKDKEKQKKQVPLRLSATLYNELAQWAEDDFRSVNGQIEYLLTECVKHRKGKQKTPPQQAEEPLDF
ncbi:MAG: Arc family DNA-binding protein [Eubacteriales bacterium]|nr:Arc family DNA-binding protein [Eubacteriales bacterium]